MFSDFSEHLRRHVLVWQLLEHLLATLADVTAAGEDEGQRPNRPGHGTQGNLVSGVSDRLSGHTRVSVIVRGSNVL